MKLPEQPRLGSGLDSERCGVCARVDVDEREVPEDKTDVVTAVEQLPENRLDSGALGALEIRVLDKGHRCVGATAYVVAPAHGQGERHRPSLPAAAGG